LNQSDFFTENRATTKEIDFLRAVEAFTLEQVKVRLGEVKLGGKADWGKSSLAESQTGKKVINLFLFVHLLFL
jgi:hypothetical protein